MTPNVLVLMSDQHRHDVMGCAGHPVVPTPNIDRLAVGEANFAELRRGIKEYARLAEVQDTTSPA